MCPVVFCPQDVDSPSLLLDRERDIAQPNPVESPQPVQQTTADPNPRNILDMAFGITTVRPAVDFSTPTESEVKPIVLPSGPSSITLFFTAIGGLGVWQLGRSARNGRFHFGHMPEWYHTGGPTQVGHVVALDLQDQTPIFCCFDRAGGRATLAYSLRRDIHMRRKSQFMLTPAAPRGPPLRTW